MCNIDNTYAKLQALRSDIEHAKVKESTIVHSCIVVAKIATLVGASMAAGVFLNKSSSILDTIEVVSNSIDITTS